MKYSRANTPVIVGVGEVKNSSTDPEHAIEPADLILDAIRRSAKDASTGESILANVDSISIVPTWTWAYPDLPGLITQKLEARANHLTSGYHGGIQPALKCDEAARRISMSKSKLAIIAGGEALASP